MTAENADTPRYTPPWTFGISNIPYGVAGTYSGVAVPFLLRKEGLPVETIAAIGALCMLPAAYQLFWAPIIDLGIRRRSWLILCSTIGSVLLAASLLISPKQHLLIYEIVLVAGQLFTGLVASCNGALVSTTVDPNKRGRAAGFINAANLGAAALGGGMVLLAHPDRQPIGSVLQGGPNGVSNVPAANLPVGSVEQVAAKVVPSVVKL
ncbi:MAG: hypothetical protein K2X81_24785, partial [Candidatus Obscuribacterales bacterium]|nr:hypothetical protein [Candidatus Obscuribacterales bacterium]